MFLLLQKSYVTSTTKLFTGWRRRRPFPSTKTVTTRETTTAPLAQTGATRKERRRKKRRRRRPSSRTPAFGGEHKEPMGVKVSFIKVRKGEYLLLAKIFENSS